jgi:hypothetical protein
MLSPSPQRALNVLVLNLWRWTVVFSTDSKVQRALRALPRTFELSTATGGKSVVFSL